MKIAFDLAKSEKNARERGLPFELTQEFEWQNAEAEDDTRFAYPERRVVATGFFRGRLHVVCFTPIKDGARIISFRRANKREIRKYEEKKRKKAAH